MTKRISSKTTTGRQRQRTKLIGLAWLAAAAMLAHACAGRQQPDELAGPPASDGNSFSGTVASDEPPRARDTVAAAAPAAPGSRPWPATFRAGLRPDPEPGARCTGAGRRRAVLCVDDSNDGAQRGTAQRPYRTIGAAIAAAKDGDTVQVATGDYRENIRIENKTLRLLGGFAGRPRYDGKLAGDFARRTPALTRATITGAGKDATVTLVGTRDAVVDGFRVIGGTGNEQFKADMVRGGGFFIDGGSATISNNLIEQNDNVTTHPRDEPEDPGAGLFAADARLRLVSNVVRNNRTGRGAVAVLGGEAHIEGNAVEDNLAIGDHGGGLYLSGKRIVVTRNFVARNVIRPKQGHGGWGAGIMVFDKGTRAELSHNLVTANHAPLSGSGIFVDDGAQAVLHHELLWANDCAKDGGSAIYVDGLDERVKSRALVENVTITAHPCPTNGSAIFVERADVTVVNSIIWGNGGDDFYTDDHSTLTVSHSLTQEKIKGAGNISAEPRFADPGGDFHLRSRGGRFDRTADGAGVSWTRDAEHSPAIDAGDPQSDVGDESSPNGGRRNLGCYGGTVQASRSTPGPA